MFRKTRWIHGERASQDAEAQAQREAEMQARRVEEELARRRSAEEQEARDAEERAWAARRAAEEQTRREAEHRARLAAEEQARAGHPRRDAIDSQEERAATDHVPVEPTPNRDAMPIYAWLQGSEPESKAIPDWPPSLVRTKTENKGGERPQD